jgi:hypothetical protein
MQASPVVQSFEAAVGSQSKKQVPVGAAGSCTQTDGGSQSSSASGWHVSPAIAAVRQSPCWPPSGVASAPHTSVLGQKGAEPSRLQVTAHTEKLDLSSTQTEPWTQASVEVPPSAGTLAPQG